MGQISDIQNSWRQILKQPASFKRVQFHVETGSRVSGRRTVVHEYPKRRSELGPYAEDMGQHAVRFSVSGYLIYRWKNPPKGMQEYVIQRRDLVAVLESDDVGTLVHPVLCPGGMEVMCERYTMTESRERGGYTQFDMQFVQAGKPGNSQSVPDTAGIVQSKSTAAQQAAVDALLRTVRELNQGGLTAANPFVPNAAEQLVITALNNFKTEVLRLANLNQ